MKGYEIPSMSVLAVEVEDVIRTSSVVEEEVDRPTQGEP